MNGDEAPRFSPGALALLAERAAAAPRIDHLPIGPLSFPQLAQWFFAQVQPQSGAFNLPKILALRGQIDIDALRRSLQLLVDRHAALRTVYRLEGAEPVQRALASRPVELAIHDLVAGMVSDPARTADTLLEEDASRPFDLAADQLVRATLVRRESDNWLLQVTFHHIAFDGWSTGVFLREFAASYQALCAGRTPELPALATQVANVAARQRAETATPRFATDQRYWRERLHDVPAPDLPLDFARGALPQHRALRRERRLPRGLRDAVLASGRAHDCTPFVVYFAAWAALTARRCGQARCLLGVAMAGRTREEWEPLLGNFVNVLPLAVDLDTAPTFATLIAQVRLRSAEAMAHQHFPFQGMASDIAPGRRSGVEGLFAVIFNFRNLPLHLPDSLPGLTITDFVAPSRGTVAPMNLNVIPDHEGGLLELDVDPDLLAMETADRWLDGYITLLSAAISAPDRPIAQLPVMGAAERDQLAEWNRTGRPADPDATLPSLFARQLAATPDRLAVRAADGDLTYRQLDGEARRLAAILRARGVGRGAIVGICMDRCGGLIAAFVGVQQAGAAYLPIDPSNPPARIVGMLEDAKVSIVIGGPGTPTALRDPRWEVVPWDAPADPTSIAAGQRPCTAGDPAYVIFTSGSTGRPKGAVISQSAIVNHMEWMRTDLPIGPGDVVLQRTSIGFDGSVWEVWAPLLNGAVLLLTPPGAERDPAALVRLLRAEQVSVLQVVPSLLRTFVELPDFAATTTLRLVCCGGEALTRELAAAFQRIHPAVLCNLYGPTETTIEATWLVVDRSERDTRVPIGRPIANVQAHVLDAHGEPAPIGVLGELHIAGTGVGLGYVNRPDLTSERFLPDPFRPQSGHTMYRTGDRVRWRHDGVLEFHGRIDHQVKLRGFRIELGEIEAALGAVAGVRLSAVVLRDTATGTPQLAAYLEVQPSAELEPATVRTQLRQALPDYMIPATISILRALPLTSSGKIDRAALMACPVDEAAPDAPVADDVIDTTLEYALRMIWARLLAVPRVGLDDDFFELGGQSLIAARMVHELEQGTGHRLPIAALFRASTIRTLVPQVLAHAYHSGAGGIREIQAGAAGQTPFFMMTGDLTGGGFYCRALAAAIDPGQPLYAIPPASPASAETAPTIEGMAAAHLAEIRRIRPSGPYRLGGFCIGGLIAYEMARQLEAGGEGIELVLLVDSIAPGRLDPLTHSLASLAGYLTVRDPVTRIDYIAHVKHRASELAAMSLSARVATMAGYPVRAVRRWWLEDAAADQTPGGSAGDSLYSRTAAHHFRARQLYRPGAYRGRVDLVRTPDPFHTPGRQRSAWRRIAAGVVVETVPAAHSEVVFTHLPDVLRRHLARLDARPRQGAADRPERR